jgi:CDP-glycerol glycerophosphotransferase
MSRGRGRLANLLGRSQSGDGAAPLLSIILPMYDVEEYLAECLDSILEQGFTDYELLVVDDGSPDGSRAIAEQYAASDERLRIITRENGGLGAARNTGIREAAGEFLTFVDSDDKLAPGALEALMTAAQDGADIVCGSVLRFADARTWPPSWVEEVHAERRTGIRALDFLPLLRNLYTWNKVFRRDFWDECGLWFREGVAYEDQPIITQLFAAATSIDVLPDVVYLYRVRPDQSSISQQVGTMKDLRDRVAAWEATREVLLRDGLREIYHGWLQTLLDAHFHWYLNAPAEVGDDYWAELQPVIARFLDEAPKALWHRALPTRRVLLELVRTDRRADAQAYVDAGGRTLDRWPGTPRDGGLDLALPFRNDPQLADDLFFLPAHLVQVEHRVDLLRWTSAGCELGGWAYLRLVDLSARSPRVELLLTNLRTGDVRRFRAETGVPAVHPPVQEDSHSDYARGTFSVTVPMAELLDGAEPRDHWSAALRVAVDGTVAEVPVTALQRPALLRSAGAGPGRRVTPDLSTGTLTFRVDGARLDLLEATADGRVVRVRFGGPALAHVVKVELGSEDQSVEATVDADGWARLELPARVHDTGQVGWQLAAYRADGSSLRGSIADPGWTDTAYADPRGAVELHRTRRNTLAVRDWALGAMADSAEVQDDELVVSGPVFGPVERLALGIPALGATGPAARIGTGRFEARLPLERDAWRFGRLPFPVGEHDLSTRIGAAGHEVVVPLMARDTLTAAGPAAVHTEHVQGRVGTRADSRLRLTVVRPLGPDRPRIVQAELRVMPARALVPGLLVPAGDDGLALVEETRRRGRPLPVWWAVPDHSWPVPDGTTPVVVGSRAWHELLASVSHVVDAGWRPVQHEQPDGQVVVQLGRGYPLGRIGLEAWRAEGLPQRQVRNRLQQVRRWDVVASPAPWASERIRAAFDREGEILETGPLRSDLLLADAETRRAQVRESLGLGDEKAVLLSTTEEIDLDALRRELDAGAVLLVRQGTPPDDDAVDVSSYPYLTELFLAADAAILADEQDQLDFAVTGKPMFGATATTEDRPLADGRAAARLLDALLR